MLDELKVAAVLAHDRDLDALRKLVGHGRRLTGEGLSRVGVIPAELLTHMGGVPISNSRHEALTAVLLAHIQATQAIDEKAASLAWIGQPTTGLQYVGNGGYVRYYEGAAVYWTPTFGAHEVHGAILERYLQMGGPRSYLGFPQTDELTAGDVRYSNFQGGTIQWTQTRGVYMTPDYHPETKKEQTGIYLLSRGTGFTPGGRVSIWIVNEGLAPKSFGSTYAGADGRFGIPDPYAYFIWYRPGDHPNSVARAVDERTRQSSDYPLSYSVQ